MIGKNSTEHYKYVSVKKYPRVPLTGNLDITYRCNNNCIHCWIRVPPNDSASNDELTYEEIKKIINEARNNGCRRWNLSGGEPMVRNDFPDILEYIHSHSKYCALSTNGTLINPFSETSKSTSCCCSPPA